MTRVLERAQRLGFIGPGPIADHVEHALGFVVVDAPQRALDLGSGGGLPGLVLALHWPGSSWVLLDANERRGAALEQAIGELGLHGRVTVRTERAERAAHDPGDRAGFDLVVARSFGPPAVTAECAAGFLRSGGRLVVSEPPGEATGRWPAEGLWRFGLRDHGRHGGVRLLEQAELAAAWVPRRVGLPAKRPAW